MRPLWLAAVTACAAQQPPPPDRHPAPPALGTSTTPQTLAIEVTGASLSPADRDAIVSRVRAAYLFASRVNAWTRPSLAPLELEIAPLPRGTAAQTTGPRVFHVAPDMLGHADVDGVLAHELTHVQDFRAAGAAIGRIPRSLEEGKALAVGHAYRMTLHECGGDDRRRQALADVSGDKAREILQTFRDGAGLRAAGRARETFLWMSVAVFFVEYLRVRDAGALAHLSHVWEQLGAGIAFDRAFADAFGAPLDTLERDFCDHLTKTQGDAAARLAGTSFATECAPAP